MTVTTGLLVLTKARIIQIIVVVAAVVEALSGFEAVHWSIAQSTIVTTEVSAVLILLLAIQQHYKPNTAEEPVAIAGSFTAATSSTVALLVGFQIVHWSDEQIALILGLVTAVIILVGSWAARAVVTAPTTPTPE